MAYGVTIDGVNLFSEFGLLLAEKPEISAPEVKSNFVDVPGADGALDFTEALGCIRYNTRTIKMKFNMMFNGTNEYHELPRSMWESRKTAIMRRFHGKRFDIVFAEDSSWTYSGRVSIGDIKSEGAYATIDMSIIADPFKRQAVEDEFAFGTTSTLTLQTDCDAPLYLKSTSNVTITLNGGAPFTFSATSTYKTDDALVLASGTNTIKFDATTSVINYKYSKGAF